MQARLSLTVLVSLVAAAGCGGGGDDALPGEPNATLDAGAAAVQTQMPGAPPPVFGAAAEPPPGLPQGIEDCPHPAWVSGRQYPAGSIVTYQAQLYFARYANPGYNPTISTYFWAPYACVVPAPCVYRDWVSRWNYKAGDIVTYQGRLYLAERDNPGYDPTISTYFWEPYTCTTPGPTPAPSPAPTPAPTPAPSPAPSPAPTPSPSPAPTPAPSPAPTPAPSPAPAPESQPFSIESQGETRFLVINWWRGDPALEGDFRQAGICTGPAPTGNCTLGARKTFRPQGFYIQNTMLWLEVPQYVNGANTYDHYPLPIELVKDPNACKFSIRHIRTHGPLEFPLNPPGLEILPHSFTMPTTLCQGFNPASATWVQQLNAALDAYLGADPFPYTPDPYPYNDPRTGRDPLQ